jgi:hypothetical protein
MLVGVLVVAFVGLLGLSAYASWHARQTAASLRAPRFDTFAEGELPAWVERKLAPLRAQLLGLGFRPFLSYSRASRRLNFTTVLTSADGHTSVHLWVSRFSGLMRWLTILHSWRAFLGDMLVLPRYGVLTILDEDRRFESTPVDLANMNVPASWSTSSCSWGRRRPTPCACTTPAQRPSRRERAQGPSPSRRPSSSSSSSESSAARSPIKWNA